MTFRAHQRGFTVIELVIVIAILIVLAAIAIPAYQDYLGKLQAAEGYSLLTSYKGPVSQSVTSEGSVDKECSRSIAQLASLPVENKVVSAIELNSENGTCRVTAIFKALDVSLAMNPKVAGKTLTLVYSPTNKSWACTTNLPDVTKPMECEPVSKTAATAVVQEPG